MGIGDMVRVHDGSWAMAIVNGSLEPVIGVALRDDRRFRVIAKDGEYPADNRYDKVPCNNIMLVDVNDSDFILFSRQSYCQVVEPCEPTLNEVRRENLKIAKATYTEADRIWDSANKVRRKAYDAFINAKRELERAAETCENARVTRFDAFRAYKEARMADPE